MEEWQGLAITLAVLFFTAGIIGVIAHDFGEDIIGEPTGVTGFYYNYVNNGINITLPLPVVGDITYNVDLIDNIIGDTGREYLSSTILGISVIPNYILIPFIIISSLVLVYAILALAKGFL